MAADPRQLEEAEILQGLVDQGGAPSKPDAPYDGPDVVENEDGSATIREKSVGAGAKAFYRNLAKDLDETELNTIATSLLELIEEDKKAREERDKQYEEGLKRMGLSKETLGGANFTGASIVTHPMYTKACIDFEARSIKEILPPGGPVREYIPGTLTAERSDRARRKAKWLNYQFTQMMPNFRAEMEQLLIQLPMGGNQYMKFLPPRRGIKIGHEWIPVDEMLLPEAATNYHGAERRTHLQKLTAQQFKGRIRSGMYRDILTTAPQEPESTKTEEAAAKIEGKTTTGENPDGKRLVYECDCLFEIRDPDGGSHTEALQEDAEGESESDDKAGETEATETGPLPYLISIDESSRTITSIYRNWDEADEDQERLEWVAPFEFIPFRGAYALGLPHIIGGLSIAATGALRALLDAALISNLPGLLKMKGAAGTGQTLRPAPTEITEIEGSSEIDDIRKLIMAIPYGQPSPVLFQLLGFLDVKGEEVIKTTLNESNDNANMPVGTQMMRVEQGMVVFSAIHGRLHNAMDKAIKIVTRINATYLEDEQVLKELGEPLVTREDFNTAHDVIPVSDPDIFCELQRYGQIQTVAQRAQLLPQVYDLRKVEELILKQMKLPNDGKDLLVAQPEPQQLNPVNENIAVALGRPIVAFPAQDSEAHIEAHCDFFESPLFQILVGGNVQAAAGLMQHLKEHIAFWYGMKVHAIASEQATAVAKQLDPKSEHVDIGELPQNSEADPEIGQKYDQMLAATSVRVMAEAQQNKMLQRAVQAIQKLQAIVQQMQPPPPTDPGAAAMADVQRQAQRDKTDAQLKGQEIQQKGQESQSDNQTRMQQTVVQEQGDTARAELAAQTKQETTAEDNATAESIAAEKISSGGATNVSDGEAVGKTAPHP